MKLAVITRTQEQINIIDRALGPHREVTPRWAKPLTRWIEWPVKNPLSEKQIEVLKMADAGYYLSAPGMSLRDQQIKWESIESLAHEIKRRL